MFDFLHITESTLSSNKKECISSVARNDYSPTEWVHYTLLGLKKADTESTEVVHRRFQGHLVPPNGHRIEIVVLVLPTCSEGTVTVTDYVQCTGLTFPSTLCSNPHTGPSSPLPKLRMYRQRHFHLFYGEKGLRK